MARRGRCRCGKILTFRRSSEGYKRRCSRCGAVVRLVEGSAAPPNGAPPIPGWTYAPTELLTRFKLDKPSTPPHQVPAAELPPALGEMPEGGYEAGAPAQVEIEVVPLPEMAMPWGRIVLLMGLMLLLVGLVIGALITYLYDA